MYKERHSNTFLGFIFTLLYLNYISEACLSFNVVDNEEYFKLHSGQINSAEG